MKARKPTNSVENKYDEIKLYSIVLEKRVENPQKKIKYGTHLAQRRVRIARSILEKFSR
ncbi:MAG: hypothetical protein QXF82_08765 [Nitrososphaeria archaeon]